MAINIVKLENGNVALYDNGTGDFLRSLSPDFVELECNVNGNVKLIQDNGNVEFFVPSLVANTQVLPAAAVPFAGTCADLAELLATDFFFEVTGVNNGLLYPKGTYTDFLPESGTITTTTSLAANEFHGLIVRILSDVTIESSIARVAAAVVGNGIIGIYKYNYNTDTWSKSAAINGLDLNVIGQQELTYPSPIKLEAGIYATGFNLSAANTMGSKNQSNMELIFGYTNLTIASSYKNKMTFNHVYDGTLPDNPVGVSIIASSILNAATIHKII